MSKCLSTSTSNVFLFFYDLLNCLFKLFYTFYKHLERFRLLHIRSDSFHSRNHVRDGHGGNPNGVYPPRIQRQPLQLPGSEHPELSENNSLGFLKLTKHAVEKVLIICVLLRTDFLLIV